MQTTGSWTLHEKAHDYARSRTESFCDDQEDALDHALIADLPNEQIRRMTRAELVRIVQAANPAFLNEQCRNRLPHLDRVALERLAFLARFCCQNQITRPQHSGKTEHARINT